MFVVWQCTADNNSNITNTVIFIYLALLQVAAIVLAIQTRRVKIKVLNDSKYIVALIYISSITLLILVVVVFALGALININELLVAGAFLIATTSFLSLTFIPKVLTLNIIASSSGYRRLFSLPIEILGIIYFLHFQHFNLLEMLSGDEAKDDYVSLIVSKLNTDGEPLQRSTWRKYFHSHGSF